MRLDHRVHIGMAKSQFDCHFKEGCHKSCTAAFLLRHVEKSQIHKIHQNISFSILWRFNPLTYLVLYRFTQWQTEEIKDKEQVYMISLAIGWLKLLKEIVLNSAIKTYVSDNI